MRVLHLVGSAVSDFYADLSRLYAADCLEATADPRLYEFHVAYVTPDGLWRFPAGLDRAAIQAAPPLGVAEAVARLIDLEIDVMVPQMFCVPGMTHYRGLFDLLGIPYVGNPPDVMASTANKARARAIVAGAGVRVPPGELLRVGEVPSLAPPVVIKPVDTDNSIGVAYVATTADYPAALTEAFAHSAEVLVESFVPLGREVRCGVMVRGGEPVCLPLEEYNVHPVDRPIRGYGDKISANASGDLRLEAKETSKAWIVDPDDPITAVVWAAALTCHRALGCRHYSLFDFRIDPDGQPWFLEAGLYWSFARTSVLSVMARAAGLQLAECFAAATAQATEVSPGT